MNFAFDSVKPKAKTLNEDFHFDFKTPRGHCFIVLDFVSHDYANLNATLSGKLQTIVSSFGSLPDFSADLFLGFVTKEINNFIHNLAEQAGGPEVLCSGALAFLSGNEFSYLLRGDTQISVLSGGGVRPLRSADFEDNVKRIASTLGASEIEAPTSEVQAVTLAESDVVLIMTQSVAETVEAERPFAKSDLNDAKAICQALIGSGGVSNEDRTAFVIAGPYQRQADSALFEKFADEIHSLREELDGKAGTITLLEIGGKIDGLAAALAGKSDNAELLELRRDVLKLGLSTKSESETQLEPIVPAERSRSSGASLLRTALVALIISLAAGFLGGWFFYRRNRPLPEVWLVKTSGNQVSITRQNGATATLELARPVKSSGEQTFSSFADVTRYIDRITTAPDDGVSQTGDVALVQKQEEDAVSEVIVKPGDSLRRFAQHYNVPEKRIKDLNPGITRWPSIKAGQRVVVPLSPQPVPSPSASEGPSPSGK